jgi:hypothetical protein
VHDEAVVRRLVGTRLIMCTQLMLLLELADRPVAFETML